MGPFLGLEGTGRFLSPKSDGEVRAHAMLGTSSPEKERKKHQGKLKQGLWEGITLFSASVLLSPACAIK